MNEPVRGSGLLLVTLSSHSQADPAVQGVVSALCSNLMPFFSLLAGGGNTAPPTDDTTAQFLRVLAVALAPA